jgi:hypothetical protein
MWGQRIQGGLFDVVQADLSGRPKTEIDVVDSIPSTSASRSSKLSRRFQEVQAFRMHGLLCFFQ